MMRARALVPAIVCLALGVPAPAALGATKFHPRIRNALGLAPPINLQQPDLPAGELQTPVTYHGGAVMSGGITVHTIFWAGSGGTHPFNPSPNLGASVPSYVGMIQQFFTDVHAAETEKRQLLPTHSGEEPYE